MQNLLQVELGERSYPIHIQQSILSNFENYPLKKGSKALIVTNETIAPLYLETVIETLKKNGVDVDHLVLKDGEQFKNQDSWYTILTALLERNHTRKSTLIALGGGVIGDLVGFAASCYQRGIDFIQIPTTLLSQVDSSVGGKTAINHPLGKNMIGSFYQPKTVLIDINTLKTLPKREFSSGLAEVIKYGIILDYDFFCWLDKHIDELMQLDEKALKYCIHRCCQLKADVVAQDETEQGKRALLNLGHTYGHAIETELGYGHWLHGEAVAVGMVMAAHASRLLGYINESEIERIINLLKKAQLPTVRPELMPIDAYIPHMLRDKKVISGEIRLVLPLQIGESMVMDHIDSEIIKQSIGLTSL